MKSLARLFQFDGYEVLDVRVSTKDQTVKIILERLTDKAFKCRRCDTLLGRKRGQHSLEVQELSIMGFKTYICLWRWKGHCSRCKKARSEKIDFLSEETPHFTAAYAEWLGTMCEFGSVSRVAEFCKQDNMTVRRLDFARMKRLFKDYKIPKITHISVDEVHARKKGDEYEDRNQRFFTVISDLRTRKVIYVSEGRSKKALDEFYILLGRKACKKISVVAMDQFDGYFNSTRQYCKNATIVWDRFHIMKNFEEAVNDVRKDLFNKLPEKDPLVRLTRGKYRFLFLKKADRRTEEEANHIEQVLNENKDFLHLELIKERMFMFFDQANEKDAKEVLDEVTLWIWQTGFKPLVDWARKIQNGWETLKNYFQFKVTTSLSEGINNVIKAIKRQAFGFRNMDYFRFKIMQKCGYLNSRQPEKDDLARKSTQKIPPF